MTLSLFRRHGRLGCPNDYDLFARPLAQLLEQIHGKTSHSGKAPSEPSPELSLERNRRELMQRLDQAVQNEAYEEAARIRDEIQVIDHQLDGT